MKSSVIQAIQHIKMSDEFMKDFMRSSPNSRGFVVFKDYSRRLNWILRDIITYPYFGDEIRNGIKREIESDAFAVDAIFDKISLLNPEQRQNMEELIEEILKGKNFKVSLIPKEDD